MGSKSITSVLLPPVLTCTLHGILLPRRAFMPVVYRCKHCGTVLHVFFKVGQDYYGIPTPSEVISLFGGVCPKCGARLHVPSLQDIRIVHLASAVKLRIEEMLARTKEHIEEHVPTVTSIPVTSTTESISA